MAKAVQIVRVIYEVDTKDLQRAAQQVAEIARQTGLSEQEVRGLSGQLSQQAGIINKLTAQERELIAARNRSNDPRQIQNFNQQIAATRAEVNRLTGEVTQSGNAMAGAFRQVGIAIGAAFAVSKIKDFLVSSVGLAASMEQNQIAFTNFTGSVDKANALLGELEQFAAKTPFEFPQLVESTKQLLAFGIEQKDVMKTLQTLGDVAAGTGTDLQGLAFVYGTIRTQQTAYTQDLNQFAARGIPIYDELAKHFEITAAQVKQFASEGKIGFKDIEAAFQGMTGEGSKFFGLMEKQSGTTSGRLSTLRDNFAELSRKIGETLLPVVNFLVTVFSKLLSVLKPVAPILVPLAGVIGTVTIAIIAFNSALVKTIASTTIMVVRAIPSAIVSFGRMAIASFAAAGPLGVLAAGIAGIGYAIYQLSQPSELFTKVVNKAKAEGKSFAETIVAYNDAIRESAAKTAQFLQNTLKFAAITITNDKIKGSLDEIKKAFDEYNKNLFKTNFAEAVRVASISELEDKLKELSDEYKNTHDESKRLEIETKKEILVKRIAEIDKFSGASKRAGKDSAELAKELKELRQEAELAGAGGADSLGGLAILRQRAIDELNARKGISQLNTEEIRALELSINAEWDAKELALKEKLAADSAKIQADLNKEIDGFRKESFDKELAAAKNLSDQRIIQAKLDFANGLISEEIMNGQIQAATISMLIMKLELQKKFGLDYSDAEQDLANERVKIQKDGLDKEVEDKKKADEDKLNSEKEALEKRKQLTADFINEAQALFQAINDLQAAKVSQQLTDLDKRRDEALKRAGGDEKKKAQIEEQFAKKREQIERAENKRKQDFAVAQAIIQGALAQAQLVVGFPATAPLMILAAAITAIQVAAIKAQKFAKGTLSVEGQGSDTSDNIPAWLSPGEAVTPAREARDYKPALRAIHMRMIPPELMNAMAMRMVPMISGPSSGFSDSRIVDKLSLQNKYSASLIKKIDRQNRLLNDIYNSGRQYRGGDFK